jgi:hypothetical protein
MGVRELTWDANEARIQLVDRAIQDNYCDACISSGLTPELLQAINFRKVFRLEIPNHLARSIFCI